MASEPLSAFLLIGLGYDTLSVAPPALPLVKWMVRRVSAARARSAAESALAARTADTVLDLLRPALAEAVDLKLLDPDARLPAGRGAASLNVYTLVGAPDGPATPPVHLRVCDRRPPREEPPPNLDRR